MKTNEINSTKVIDRFKYRSVFLIFFTNIASFNIFIHFFSENKYLLILFVSLVAGLSLAFTRSFIDSKRGFSKYFLFNFGLAFSIMLLLMIYVVYFKILV